MDFDLIFFFFPTLTKASGISVELRGEKGRKLHFFGVNFRRNRFLFGKSRYIFGRFDSRWARMIKVKLGRTKGEFYSGPRTMALKSYLFELYSN